MMMRQEPTLRPRVRQTVRGALLLLACAVGGAHPVQAQAPGPRGEVLTLVRISGTVHPQRPAEPPLPFALLEQIERDPFLVQLETRAQVQTGPALVVTFGFPSVAAYRAWSEAPETRQLLDALRTRVSQMETTVSLSRGPHALVAAGGG